MQADNFLSVFAYYDEDKYSYVFTSIWQINSCTDKPKQFGKSNNHTIANDRLMPFCVLMQA